MSRPLASRGLGWLAAGVSAAAILSGAAALALTAQRAPGPAIFLDLSQAVPTAAAVAAVADPAPRVVDEAPALDAPAAAAEAAPPPPGAEAAPDLPQAVALPATLPDLPAVADLALPPPPQTPVPETAPEKPVEPKVARVEPEPKPRPEPRPESKPEEPRQEPKPEEPRQEPEPKKKPAEAAPATTRAKVAAASAATATKASARAVAGGGVSPASYAKAVMKKVRATKKKKGAGRGAVVIGFTVAANGGLASVQVVRSSGNAALDQVGVDHIRRAAPFPAPPADAGRSFSFEFVGR